MTAKERLDRHDRQIAAITKLLKTGMRMLVKVQEEQAAQRDDQAALRKEVRAVAAEVKSVAAEVRSLAAMQKRTEASLQGLINTMRRGTNGHSKKPAGLQ